jgi:hypothetical protein
MENVEDIIQAQKRRGLVVVATNEPRETAWADVMLRIDCESAS